MIDLIRSGGWLMLPILLCSALSLGFVIERLWSLQTRHICPEFLLPQISRWFDQGVLDAERIQVIRTQSPLGRVLASGLDNLHHDREIIRDSIEETGRHVVQDLERYLNSLGTIAAITPLLGLLGTVVGMIEVFSAITLHGVGDAQQLSGGISKALITTAAGLTVAIPTLVAHRYFNGRVRELATEMELQALRLVEVLEGEREETEG